MIFKGKENNLLKLENDIFRSIQYFRLKNDLDIINKALEDSKVDPNVKNYNLIKRFSNFINESYSEALNEEKTKVEERIIAFKEANQDINYNLVAENKIQESFNKLYIDDKYELKRYLLAVRIILDNEYEYSYNDNSFIIISTFMFNDLNKLSEIKERLEAVYLKIAKKPLSDSQKAVLVALGFASAVSLGVFSLVGAAASTVGISTCALALGELSLIGVVGASMKAYNKKLVKDEYKSLTVEESAFFLTLKALLIEEGRARMPEDEFKESLSEILEVVDDMRSEVSFLLFVAGDNDEVNKEKLNQFHNFDKYMIKAFAL